MVMIRSPFCGYNTIYCVELNGEELSVIRIKLNQLVYDNVHMTTDLPTKRIQTLSQWQTFLGVFTHKMAAKIKWHRYETKLRHCHPM